MKKNIPHLFDKSKLLFKEKLGLSLFILFLIWMTFFDSLDFVYQMKIYINYKRLLKQKEYYIENIKKLEEYKKAINNDKFMLEKLAREKYFMKKKGEDIYIIQK